MNTEKDARSEDETGSSGSESPDPTSAGASVDAGEIARFAAIAEEWWDPHGKFKPLHQLNPTRLGYVRQQICAHFGRDVRANTALAGLKVLDIGCGGGLLCEPIARQGATTIGIDPSEKTIRIAKAHARSTGAEVTYEATTVEAMVEAGRRFDVVIATEVVEHVNDVEAFVAGCATLVAPGGLFIASTINRTLKAYALAIVGAERVMRWLPVGTHQYDKLVQPKELESAVTAGGLTPIDTTGMVYNPLTGAWRLSERDLDVNYLLSATGPA